MKKLLSIVIAMVIMLMSCTVFAATDISGGVIQIEGIGALQNKDAAAGYRAAKVDAMRNALEEVQGVYIDSETTVKDSIMTSDIIKSRINGLIKGAKVVKRFKDGDGYHVIIEMPVYGAQSIAASAIPESNAKPQAFPAATTFVPNVPTSTGAYTGLIVDCTGLGLETAMAPAVFATDDKLVYGQVNYSRDMTVKKGYVGYSNSLNSGISRAGSNPLVVKAQSVKGFVSPVVSLDDAAKILAENKASGFLTRGNVVFVK